MARATPLEHELKTRIAREGPLSFREVMTAALYHPQYGYYTHLRGFGADGDFITSPEQHPAFGWLLGRQALDVWEALGQPAPFRILELGGGSGALAESLIGFMRKHVPRIIYTLDEVSPSLKRVQQERLKGDEFRWYGTEEEADFIIANEVVDALPVHRAVVRGGEFYELLVGVNDRGALSFEEATYANQDIAQYFEALNYVPPDETVVDVCLGLTGWLDGVTRRLRRGLALVIDYAASPPRDTLLTYYRHTMGSDPLVRLGEQDISAHGDLGRLIRLAIHAGLKAGAVSQRRMLFNLGYRQIFESSPGQTDREALTHLIQAHGPGDEMTAVFLMRDMPEGYSPAMEIGRTWPEPQDVPRVAPDQDEDDFLSQWREAFASSETEEEVAEA